MKGDPGATPICIIRKVRTRRAQGLVKLVIVAAVLCAAGAAALLTFMYMRPAVTVTRVIEGPVVQAFYATGTVQPQREYPINTNVAGIVEKVLVDKADEVKAGQVVAVVTDSALIYAADKAKADLEQKQAFADEKTSPVLQEYDAKIKAAGEMFDVGSAQEKRLLGLAEKNAASWTDHDNAYEHMKTLWSELESLKSQRAAKLRSLQTDVQIAQAAVQTAQWNLHQQTLTSPVDGVVLDRPVSQGTRLEINGHVMQIANIDPQQLVMRAEVDEENIAHTSPGQAVRMTLYSFPGESFKGTVKQRVYPKADPSRRTFEVDVAFAPADVRLRAGMTGELAFIEHTRDRALIVPAQAVQNGAVWTIRNGRLAKAAADLGIRSIERVEIVSGMENGQTVVISPIGDLREGKAVRIGSVMDPKVAADLNSPKATEVFKAFRD